MLVGRRRDLELVHQVLEFEDKDRNSRDLVTADLVFGMASCQDAAAANDFVVIEAKTLCFLYANSFIY